MDYTQILSACAEREQLISMVSMERIVALGYQLGLNESSRVLDFCCGCGTMLKIWSEAFGICGIGIDRDAAFIEAGKARLTNDRVTLIAGDMFQYADDERYDVVLCTELSCGADGHDVPFESLAEGLRFLARFSKPGGRLVFGRLFSKIPNPPKALTDFDGALPTLGEVYAEIRQCGYFLIAMASDSTAEWERYITQSAKRDLARLRQEPKNEDLSAWIDTWYRIYFEYRRPYEGWGLFGIERL